MASKGISCYIFVVLSLLLSSYVEASISKISLKKSIEGKEKYLKKIKLDFIKPITITSGTTTEFDDTTVSTFNAIPAEEKIQLKQDFNSTTAVNKDILSTTASTLTLQGSTTELKQDTTTTSSKLMRSSTKTSISQEDLSCTCGIFLSSQFVKGSPKPPTGEPVISNILDRTFFCNPIGQRQCQTKCLEQIVQHLPNSANILCASLDRDVQKERAYLFIKNCSNQWYNTNLAAGREYCCKNGQPYKCTK